MASEGVGAEREAGRTRPLVGTGSWSCLGLLPDAEQSNALLILITEMILIHTGPRTTLLLFREGPVEQREGGGRKVTAEGCPLPGSPASYPPPPPSPC